ncbi:MAG: acyl-ACP--UDP-N- acetylglucosamine O-acyltransferase [Mycobacteriales bacterium]
MNRVHPTALIGAGVDLGDGNVVGPYAVLLGPAIVGDANWFGPHVVVGTPGEIRGIDHGAAWFPEDADRVGTGVRIGDRNVLREYTTVHQGHYAVTAIGDDCYVMNKGYVGHDDVIVDSVTMASSVTLGGHVHVGAGANLGMGATVHQRRVVGPGAMVGMGAVVTRDVPPYALAHGTPCRVRGVNRAAIERDGVPDRAAAELATAYAAGRVPSAAEVGTGLAAAWAWWSAETAAG